eukprot:83052_1
MTMYLTSIILCLFNIKLLYGSYRDCKGLSKCEEATIDCNAGEHCTVDCIGQFACLAATFNCKANSTCIVLCQGDEACWGAVFNAYFSSELTINGCIHIQGSEPRPCENIDVYCPPNVAGNAKCHLSGNDKGLANCTPNCGDGDAGEYGLHFFATNGWVDIDFSAYTGTFYTVNGFGPGKMHCLGTGNINTNYDGSCDIGTLWTCSGNTQCDLTLNPTTSIPTTITPTTSSPTTSAPTTAYPTSSAPTTASPITSVPTTLMPSTSIPTSVPTTASPTTSAPTTLMPSTYSPTTAIPTTSNPTMRPTIPSPTLDVAMLPTFTPTMNTYLTVVATDEDNSSIDRNSDASKITLWMIIAICLMVIVIALFIMCVVVVVKCKHRNEHNDKVTNISQNINNKMVSNIQLTKKKNEFQGNHDVVASFSSGDIMTNLTSMNDDGFIVNGEDKETPRFTNVNDDEFIIDGNDENNVITPQFNQTKHMMDNDEFIINGNDENMVTPNYNNMENDQDEHTEGDVNSDNIDDDNDLIVTDKGENVNNDDTIQ